LLFCSRNWVAAPVGRRGRAPAGQPWLDQGAVAVFMVKFIRAWTWQAIAIYLLAEFAIFTIFSRLKHAWFGVPPQPWWVDVVLYFLPLTLSAWWVLGVLFSPRAQRGPDSH
jgi:hypothetical protein